MRTQEEILADIANQSKVCTRCGERKDFSEFYTQSSSPDGRAGYCIACKTQERRNHHLKHKYGITEDHYFAMIDEQWGCCAICGAEDETIGEHLHVDHDHSTGAVRGLLCGACNKGLGLLRDNVKILKSAIRYLERSEETEEINTMIITGTAQWAHIQKPDDRFPPAKYSINVVVDDNTAKELREVGLRVKKEGDQHVFKVKRNVLKVDGTEAGRPNVVDVNNDPFNQDIGNGSKVNVQIRPYQYSNNFGTGMSADLEGVQVIELVEFSGGGGSEFAPVKAEDL